MLLMKTLNDYMAMSYRMEIVEDKDEGVGIHEPDSLEDYSGQFKLRIPRSLHRSLAEHSQREGILCGISSGAALYAVHGSF